MGGPRMVATLPEKVRETLYAMRKDSKHKLAVTTIRGNYYLIEYEDIIDPDGRLHREALYLGKINADGTFEKAVRRLTKDKISSLDAKLRKDYSSMIDRRSNRLLHPDELDLNLLTAMSMDGRASVPDIARSAGVEDPDSVRYRIERLIKEYGIRFTVEIKPDTFGFTRFLILVRFLSGRPAADRIKEVLEKERRIQTVVLTEGDYHMLIYIAVESVHAMENIIYRIRSDEVFSGYRSIWDVSYLEEAYGWYIPMRDEFFELLKERVWKRKRVGKGKRTDQLFLREYAVLRELNSDSRMDFTTIDIKYGLSRGSASYTYGKLLESATIERSTITMESHVEKHCAFLYLRQVGMGAFNSTRIGYLESTIEDTGRPTNKFIYAADASSPNGAVLVAPIYDDGGMERLKEEMQGKVKGIRIKSAVMTNFLIGNLGFRRFDMEESSNADAMRRLIEEKRDTANKSITDNEK